jgi:MFS family permease
LPKPKPILAIFLTVLFDLLAFSIVIPDIQLRAEKLTSGLSQDRGIVGILIGLAIAAFSVAQFLVAPYLGRISDRSGRRPVLLITCALAFVSALVYTGATTYLILLLARILQGMAGANIGVAYAYVSDITTDEERGKSMGLLGMAFGIGFMFGPPLGAFLLQLGQGSPLYVGLASAFFALINFLFVAFFLPESRAARPQEPRSSTPQLLLVLQALKAPGLGRLLLLFFAANFAFTHLETTFFLLGEKSYKFAEWETTLVLVFVGIVAVAMQGGLIRILLPRFGEVNLLRWGYLLQAPAMALIPWAVGWPMILAGALVLGIGSGMSQPSLSSLVSKSAPSDMTGSVFGVTQSLGAVARMVGPLSANFLFQIQPHWPYTLAAVLLLIPLAGAWTLKREGSIAQEA